MKLKKLELGLFFGVVGIMFLAMFLSVFLVVASCLAVGALSYLPLLTMDPQYRLAVALKKYELEIAIVEILHSAGAITGRKDDWITMRQIIEEMTKRFSKEYFSEAESWVIMSALIRREIVEAGSEFGSGQKRTEVLYRLRNKAYRPKKPDNSIEVKDDQGRLCVA